MRFEQFRMLLEEMPVLSLSDIRHQEPDFYLPRLSEWQKKNKLIKLRQGMYSTSDFFQKECHLYFAANRMYTPSYVSFETALSAYSIIPEATYKIISATSNKTQYFKSPIGSFSYHHINSRLMFGYILGSFEKWTYRIASLEKAILDFLYIHSDIQTLDDFDALRWNTEQLKMMDWETVETYLTIFDIHALRQRIHTLKRYISR